MTTKQIYHVPTDSIFAANTETLHVQSKQWLQALAIWQDEIRFFNHLLKKEQPHQYHTQQDGKEKQTVLGHLVKLEKQLANDLATGVVLHEKELALLLQKEQLWGENEELKRYKDKHQQLNDQLHTFETTLQELKFLIYEFMK